MKSRPTGLHVAQLRPLNDGRMFSNEKAAKEFSQLDQPLTLSPKLRRARVACLQAQAHFDALSGEPAALAWAEVMDAFWQWVSTPGEVQP